MIHHLAAKPIFTGALKGRSLPRSSHVWAPSSLSSVRSFSLFNRPYIGLARNSTPITSSLFTSVPFGECWFATTSKRTESAKPLKAKDGAPKPNSASNETQKRRANSPKSPRKRPESKSTEKEKQAPQQPSTLEPVLGVEKRIINGREVIISQYSEAWTKLTLNGRLLRAVHEMGFKEPTEIQKKVVRLAVRGHSVVGSAKTGTGKTAAFMLPALHRLHLTKLTEAKNDVKRAAQPLVLVLTPTKELAEQIANHTHQFSKYIPEPKIYTLFSKIPESVQIAQLSEGVDILISTPGRLQTLLKMDPRPLSLDHVQTFVVDECDRMLSMGFISDILEIWSHIPRSSWRTRPSPLNSTQIQTLLFSATLVPKVQEFIKRLCPNGRVFDLNDNMQVADGVRQIIFEVSHVHKKSSLLLYLIRRKGSLSLRDKQVLIFVRTRQKADRLATVLKNKKINATAIHKGFGPTAREEKIKQFQEGKIQIMIATDVMARGLDIPFLPYVINYDVPSLPEDYIHRIGRTGRAGATGLAITFVSLTPQILTLGGRVVELNEAHSLKDIERVMNRKLKAAKIPGPWKDMPLSEAEVFTQREKEKVVEQLKLLMKKKKETNLPRPLQKNPNMKLADLSLRNFSEGRFEDVVQQFDTKRALRSGKIIQRNGKFIVPSKPKLPDSI